MLVELVGIVIILSGSLMGFFGVRKGLVPEIEWLSPKNDQKKQENPRNPQK